MLIDWKHMTSRSLQIEPDALDDRVAESLRRMTPGERIQLAADANDTARILAAAGIRYLHPNWSEQQVQQEVARRMLNAAD